jgi:hypothetical protein
VQDVVERSREKSNMLQGFGDVLLRAEALEDQFVKSRKHAAAMQAKLAPPLPNITMTSKSCRQRATT